MTKQLERAIFFVDGSNFYHSMVEKLGLRPSGLNYSKLSQKLAGNREWIETRFYIGQLKQEPNKEEYAKQRRFLSMLEKQDKVNIFPGRVERRTAKNTVSNLSVWLDNISQAKENETVPSWAIRDLRDIATKKEFVWVEKAVDVNIAIDMVSMAHDKKYDVAYLLSADGDYTPAIQKVRDIGCKVFVASPAYGNEISRVADTFISLKREHFHGCWE